MSGIHKINQEGREIVYKATGTGQPVVLLHGFAEDSEVWKYQVEALKDNYRLILPDLTLPPFRAGYPLSMESLADDVAAILTYESISSCVLIGHSMGGYIALAFAEKYPSMLAAFGFFHSTAYADSPEKKVTRQRSIEFIRTHGTYEFLTQSVPNLFSPHFRTRHTGVIAATIAQYKNLDPALLVACYEGMMQRPDRTHVLRSFDKPVLFIIGRHDNAVPFAQSLQQCYQPQLSYIHILENSGHMGMWEETAEGNQILTSFLQDVLVN